VSAPNPQAPTKKRILVAEDDAAIATLLVRVLSQHFDVVHAEDGISALKKAAELPPPQLLLLDVMLPGADGYIVAQGARAIPHLKQVPIIFLTARTAVPDVIRGIQHGARHYIHKPFKIEEVLTKIKKTLGE
jgi:putative two-component system response regulator